MTDFRKMFIGVLALVAFVVLGVQFARLVSAAPEREVAAACRGLASAPQNSAYNLTDGATPAAIDFEVVDHTGKKVKLSDFRGKVVLVNFWASWCNVCRSEKPGLEALQNQYRDQNLVVLSLASDTDWGAVRKALPAGSPLKVLLDPPASADENLGKVAKQYGITAVPETFVVDKEGRLRYYLVNRRDWNSDIAHTCLRALL